MSELTGAEWLNSCENRSYERRVLRPLVPFIVAGTALARTAVRLIENDPHPIKLNERSLIPGHVYTIEKIGTPEPQRKISQLLCQAMLDELPQLHAAWKGKVALVGPRGTLPQHRELLFDAIGNGKIVDDWRDILSQQKHGILGTYAIQTHQRVGENDDFSTLQLADLAEEALIRYEADRLDFVDASLHHSKKLVKEFTGLVQQKVFPE